VSRNHRTPGIARAICTHRYHHDSAEFTEHGFHYLCTLKLRYLPQTNDFTIVPRDNASRAFRKDFRRADGLWVYRFRCSCGLDPQRLETYLVGLILQYSAANPSATRFDLDITTI
jgi:hypothetical protein